MSIKYHNDRHKIIASKYPPPKWAVGQILRETGLVEDACEHGVGHPNLKWLETHCTTPSDWNIWSTHGCDGCCCKGDINEQEAKYHDCKDKNEKPDAL